MTLKLSELDYFYGGRRLNFAHRGARLHAPENTLPAFEKTLSLGIDGAELDVQLTTDGVVVVFHDQRLSRTSDGEGILTEKTLAELRELDAGYYFSQEYQGTKIPTLDEVFELVGQKLLINVELKSVSLTPSLAEAVDRVIKRHNMERRVLISSFNPIQLRHARRVSPQIPRGFLHTTGNAAWLWKVRALAGDRVANHPDVALVNEAYIVEAHRRDQAVNVWGVAEVSSVRRLCRLGVDMIVNDCPELVQKIFQEEAG